MEQQRRKHDVLLVFVLGLLGTCKSDWLARNEVSDWIGGMIIT